MSQQRFPDPRQLRLRALALNRPLLGPQSVHFDIANACNTRCSTCWHHSPLLLQRRRPPASWTRRMLPLERYCAILDEIAALGGLEQIILSGMGEPTLNPALHEMVRYAHRQGIGVTIITNLLGADLGRLLDSPGELQLLVSICGVTPEVWQQFHSDERGWSRLLRQLQRLRQRGFRAKQVQVINAQNYQQLEQMVQFAAEWQARRVNFKLASLGHGTEATALSREQQLELRDRLVPRARQRARELGVETDLAAFARQIRPGSLATAPHEQVGCYMGLLYCRVTVDAELLLCCNTEVSVGTLDAQTSFASLWQGERYRQLRTQLRARQFFPGCQQCGKFKQNLKWAEQLRAARSGVSA